MKMNDKTISILVKFMCAIKNVQIKECKVKQIIHFEKTKKH